MSLCLSHADIVSKGLYERAVLLIRASLDLPYTCVLRELRYLENHGYFSLELSFGHVGCHRNYTIAESDSGRYVVDNVAKFC